jgi:hypothetical protein
MLEVQERDHERLQHVCAGQADEFFDWSSPNRMR